MLLALVHVLTPRHGTRRSTELVHVLRLVDAAERRTDNYDTLFAQLRLLLHEIYTNKSLA